MRKASTTTDLRIDRWDRSQKQGDSLIENYSTDGKPTVIDYGITHTLLHSYTTNKENARKRGFGANVYATDKDRGYQKVITAKNLDINYLSFTVETYGAFGDSTWKLINDLCDPRSHPDATKEHNPWNYPGPKRDFVLATGFAIQRGNAMMLSCANSRRRSSRSPVRGKNAIN